MQTEIKEQPPYNVVTIGNAIIRYGMQEGRRLTNVELQILLYMTQLIHIGLTGAPMFLNKMEAWDSGPTIPDAYAAYREFGDKNISTVGTWELELLNPMSKIIVKNVMEQTKSMTTKDLCRITKHQDPWMNSYVSYDTREIPLKEIENLAEKIFHKMPDKIRKEVAKNQ